MAKWRDVRGWLLSYIQEHGLLEGSTLPSDREIARACGCSLQPVLHAMRDLAAEGVIQRQAGAATQIRSLHPAMEFHSFSFSASAQRQGVACNTRVLEQCRRLPNPGELHLVERRAQSELGLPRTEPFYVIARLRILDNQPRVIERAYLNPAHFPHGFLEEHDFGAESLIQVYRSCSFDPILRDTALKARLAGEEEKRLLGIGAEPILEAEQEMRARHNDEAAPVVIEYLHAVYRDWTFRLVDRRPIKPGSSGSQPAEPTQERE